MLRCARVLTLATLLLLTGVTRAATDDKDVSTAVLNDRELVATADVIVVGTVTTARRLPGVAADWAANEIVLKVEKTIKGKVPAELTFRHRDFPKPPGPAGTDAPAAATGPVDAPAPATATPWRQGDRRLFFLATCLDTYLLVGGLRGVQPSDDADRYTDLLATLPVSVTLAPLAAPIRMGDYVKATFTVTNHSDLQVLLYDPTVGGYFGHGDLHAPTFFMAHDDSGQGKASVGTVPAHGTLQVTATLKAALGAKDLPANGTLIPLRLRVFAKPYTRNRDDGYYLQSEPQRLEVRPAFDAPPTLPKR